MLRGYVVARQVIEGGLEKNPDHWALQLAKASLDHDENNYRQEIAKSSEYSERLRLSLYSELLAISWR